MSERGSGVAVGFALFASVMMVMIGVFHIVAGLAGIIENEFYVATPNYVFGFDVTTWGWIHLIWGAIVLIAGFSLWSGAVWARTVGVFLAALSAIVNFAFIPYQPVWSIVTIGLAVTVIWALTVRGRDIAG